MNGLVFDSMMSDLIVYSEESKQESVIEMVVNPDYDKEEPIVEMIVNPTLVS